MAKKPKPKKPKPGEWRSCPKCERKLIPPKQKTCGDCAPVPKGFNVLKIYDKV